MFEKIDWALIRRCADGLIPAPVELQAECRRRLAAREAQSIALAALPKVAEAVQALRQAASKNRRA